MPLCSCRTGEPCVLLPLMLLAVGMCPTWLAVSRLASPANPSTRVCAVPCPLLQYDTIRCIRANQVPACAARQQQRQQPRPAASRRRSDASVEEGCGGWGGRGHWRCRGHPQRPHQSSHAGVCSRRRSRHRSTHSTAAPSRPLAHSGTYVEVRASVHRGAVCQAEQEQEPAVCLCFRLRRASAAAATPQGQRGTQPSGVLSQACTACTVCTAAHHLLPLHSTRLCPKPQA